MSCLSEPSVTTETIRYVRRTAIKLPDTPYFFKIYRSNGVSALGPNGVKTPSSTAAPVTSPGMAMIAFGTFLSS